MEIDLKEIKTFCDHYNLNFSKVKVYPNGCIYLDSITFDRNFQGTELPQALKYFKEIRGSLIIENCINLKDLTSLQNVQKICNDLYINNTPIESLKGLENLKIIGNVLNIYNTNVKDFTDLKSLTKVFNYILTDFETFDGLENVKLKKIFKYINPRIGATSKKIIYDIINVNEYYKFWKNEKDFEKTLKKHLEKF